MTQPEDRLLMQCARQDFGEASRGAVLALCQAHTLDWMRIWRTARQHGIAPLIYVNLRTLARHALGMPVEVDGAFNRHMFDNIRRRSQSAQSLADALAVCRLAGQDAMVLRTGVLHPAVYAQPWYTYSEDIDLLLRTRRDALTSEAASILIGGLDRIDAGRGPFQENIEYDFFAHHDMTLNGVLPLDFKAIWQAARQTDFRGEPMWLLSAEDQVLALCISAHRKRYFRLKALCDLRETILFDPHLDWAVLCARARAWKCSAIVFAALVCVDLTLGLSLPDDLPARLALPAWRSRLLRGLAQRLLSRATLLQMYSTDPAKRLHGRQFSISLLLTFCSYTPGQALQKMWHAITHPAM